MLTIGIQQRISQKNRIPAENEMRTERKVNSKPYGKERKNDYRTHDRNHDHHLEQNNLQEISGKHEIHAGIRPDRPESRCRTENEDFKKNGDEKMNKKTDWGSVAGTVGTTVAVGLMAAAPPLWIAIIAAGLGYRCYELSKMD